MFLTYNFQCWKCRAEGEWNESMYWREWEVYNLHFAYKLILSYNEVLCNLYFYQIFLGFSNQGGCDRWGVHVACMIDEKLIENVIWKIWMKDFLEDPGTDEKLLLKMCLEIGYDVHWIHVAYDRVKWRAVVNIRTNLPLSLKMGNFLHIWATDSSSRRAVIHGVSEYYLLLEK